MNLAYQPVYDPTGKKLAASRNVPVNKPSFAKQVKYTAQYGKALYARPPWRTVSMVVWIIFGGWLLFLAYATAGLLLMLTIIFIPFGVQAFRLALFALNPIGKENYIPDAFVPSQASGFWFKDSLNNPHSPVTIAANVVWLLLFGWIIFLGHALLVATFFISIIGIPLALKHAKLAVFALWPFGQQVRYEPLPKWPNPPVTIPIV
ncbi:hypothetical protein MP228_000363 [Amoeboaphelidium protococcarum]|nr:hypothetical protein MP228_000363 [Amoeboaphelidium protococcarum]